MFTQDNYKTLIINNGGKILILLIVLFYLIPLLRSESANYFIGVTYILAVVIFLFVLINYKIKKFIHEIEINFDTRTVLLKTYRCTEVIEIGFDGLIINKKFGFLIFNFRSNKFFYNGDINDELINCVNRIMNVKRHDFK